MKQKDETPLPPLDEFLYTEQKGRCALCGKRGVKDKMWIDWVPPGLMPRSLMHPECYDAVFTIQDNLALTKKAVAFLESLPRGMRYDPRLKRRLKSA